MLKIIYVTDNFIINSPFRIWLFFDNWLFYDETFSRTMFEFIFLCVGKLSANPQIQILKIMTVRLSVGLFVLFMKSRVHDSRLLKLSWSSFEAPKKNIRQEFKNLVPIAQASMMVNAMKRASITLVMIICFPSYRKLYEYYDYEFFTRFHDKNNYKYSSTYSNLNLKICSENSFSVSKLWIRYV